MMEVFFGFIYLLSKGITQYQANMLNAEFSVSRDLYLYVKCRI